MVLYLATSTNLCFSITLQNWKHGNCTFSLKHYTSFLPTDKLNKLKLSPDHKWTTRHSQSEGLFAPDIRNSANKRCI